MLLIKLNIVNLNIYINFCAIYFDNLIKLTRKNKDYLISNSDLIRIKRVISIYIDANNKIDTIIKIKKIITTTIVF